jgi:hypothetical protein
MQLDSMLAFAVATGVTLLIVLVATVFAAGGPFRRVQNKHEHGVYEDEDGKATRESWAIYSITRQKLAVVAWATVGLGCHATYSASSQMPQSPDEEANEESAWMRNWLVTAAWVRAYLTHVPAIPVMIGRMLMEHTGLSRDTSNRHSSHPRPCLRFSTRCISGCL